MATEPGLAPSPGARFAPKTIRSLALAVAIVCALVTAMLGGLTYWVVHEEIERQIDHRVEIETRALLQYGRDHGFTALVQAIRIRDETAQAGDTGYLDAHDGSVDRAMGYILLDARGVRHAGALDATMPPLGWSEFVHFTRADGSPGIAQAMHSPLPDGGHLLVAAGRAIVDQMDSMLFRLFLAAFGTLLLVAVGATLAFGRTIRRRLRVMERRATAIMAGDLAQRMPVDGSGAELDRLAVILNRMLERIQALIANLREVSNGLAHDLRTPLSRMQAKLERAEALATDTAQRELLGSAGDEANRLLHLFDSLLAIAEIDGKAIQGRFVPIDLATAVSEIAEAHRPAFEDAGLGLIVSTAPAWIQGDKPLLQRLVGNLLDNALVHASGARTVTVAIEAGEKEVELQVSDDGPGVPPKDRERIFERLVRLDESRRSPGHGLGLSLVATIAKAHGGTAAVVPTQHGLTVSFRAPALSLE